MRLEKNGLIQVAACKSHGHHCANSAQDCFPKHNSQCDTLTFSMISRTVFLEQIKWRSTISYVMPFHFCSRPLFHTYGKKVGVVGTKLCRSGAYHIFMKRPFCPLRKIHTIIVFLLFLLILLCIVHGFFEDSFPSLWSEAVRPRR